MWNIHLSDHLRSQSEDAGSKRTQAFPEIQALYSLWQSSGKSVNLWDWLDGFRQAVVPQDKQSDSEDDQTALDDETNSHLHALFIRFVEEARLFGTVRARGKNTVKRGDEVVKGVVMS